MKFVRCKDYKGDEILINLGRIRKVTRVEDKADVVHTIDGDVLEVFDNEYSNSFEDAIIDI